MYFRGGSPPRAPAPRCEAEGTLGILSRAVRTAWRPDDEVTRIYRKEAAGRRQREPVQSARRRPGLVLTGTVVLRAVARTLEPLRRLAERNAATEVHAPLVQRHQPAGE